jgi:hypothetical protein
MGMFDNLILLGKSAELVVCGHGHSQEHLQSKSLECLLDDYYVYERVLYRNKRASDERLPRARQMEEGKLTLRFESEARCLAHTGEVVAYTHCEACDPIVYESEASFFGSSIRSESLGRVRIGVSRWKARESYCSVG